MNKLIMLILSLAAIPSFGLEETNQTLTPGAGQSEARINLDYVNSSESAIQTSSTFTSTGLYNVPLNPDSSDSTLSYYYGINENVALGVALGYANISASGNGFSSKDNGLTGLTLGYKGNLALAAGMTLFTAVAYEASLGKSSSSTNNHIETGNGFLSQNTLAMTAGPVFDTGRMMVGGLLKYTYKFDGTSDDTSSGTETFKIKGGDELTFGPMVELKNDFHPNFQLVYGRKYGYTSTSNTVYDGESGLYGSGWYALTVSSRYAISPGFEINGAVSYASLLANSLISSSSNLFSIALGARFIF